VSAYTVHVGSDAELGDRARAVRRAVFIDEQGVSEAEEMDDNDAEATQLLATDSETPVGTARIRFVDDATAKIERVAVKREYREEGVGTELMTTAEQAARDSGAEKIRIHAQCRVKAFYHSLGYETVSDEFEEAGIPHVEMVKRLR